MNEDNPTPPDDSADEIDDELRLAVPIEPQLPKLEDYVDPHELETETAEPLEPRSEPTLGEQSVEEQWFSRAAPSAFGFFLQSDVILRLVGLVIACALTIYTGGTSIQLAMADGHGVDGIIQLVGSMALWLVTIAVTIPWIAVTSIFGLTILQSTAAGEDSVRGWPEGPWLEWLAPAWSVIIPLLSTVVPAAYVAYHLAVPAPLVWIYVPGVPYLLFPIVFLSMTNANSLLVPLSSDVIKSFRDRPGAWLLFYFESGFLVMVAMSALISCMWLVYVAGWLITAFPAAVATMASIFLYFRLLGRLTRRVTLS